MHVPTLLSLAALVAFSATAPAETVLRVGHFPNVTHAQGLIASYLSRQGKGWFEPWLGPEVKMQWFHFNAGPSAMEAIFTGAIELTYVGPTPALNAYAKSRGEEIRLIAGAVNGGAALVVQPDGRIGSPQDFKGRKLATPQLGNTQDIAARAWLKQQGFRITQLGGEVFVIPTQNPDQLSLFSRRQIDAVWTIEPWVSRLEMEAGGKIYLEQKHAVTTVLATSVKTLRTQPELVKKFAAAHAALTAWINANPAEAKLLVIAALKEITRADFQPELADRAWSRLTFTSEISSAPFEAIVAEAQSVGFLKEAKDLSRLVVPLAAGQ
jgi:NitT/TauT family transport system substrate-binding protein